MDVEVWHERGCGRIGEITEGIRFTRTLGEGWWRHVDCPCPLAGTTLDQLKEAITVGWSETTTMRRVSTTIYRHVENPRYAQDDARTQQQRLDGWLAAILAIPDRTTRAAVSDSLTAHIARHGEVP